MEISHLFSCSYFFLSVYSNYYLVTFPTLDLVRYFLCRKRCSVLNLRNEQPYLVRDVTCVTRNSVHATHLFMNRLL
jgi:hypothetical protein